MTEDQTQQPGSFALLFQAPDPEAMRATRAPRSERSVDDGEDEAPAQPSPRRSRRAQQDDAEGSGRGQERRRRGRGARDDEARASQDQDEQREEEAETSTSEDEAEQGSGRRRRRPERSTRRRGQAVEEASEDEAEDATSRRGRGQDAESSDEGEDSEGEEEGTGRRARRRRGGRGRSQADEGGQSRGRRRGASQDAADDEGSEPEDDGRQTRAREDEDESDARGSRRARKRSRGGRRRGAGQDGEAAAGGDVTDEVTGVQGSTRLAAKKQRRREGREAGRKRTVITEAEFLARRESVERTMVVRESEKYTQVGVLEDGVLVEHYIDRQQQTTMVGNVYLGRVQNVLPSMEAAFVDIGKGRNGVLYAGEVNWEAAGLPKGEQKRIEAALQPGQTVLVQVTKDPIGHKGARLTAQVSLPGRYLVYVPGNSTTGISRKLPDTERARLKKILKDVVPAEAGVIVRTAAEGASEAELRADVERLSAQWERIASAQTKGSAPVMVHGEPDLTVRVIRDVFNEDFTRLVVSGDGAWESVTSYIDAVAPDLSVKLERWEQDQDIFEHHRVEEQIAKAMDRKVWLPSGGSLIIDRTEAMTVVDVNTGKFVGSGGNLEETVTKNNIEAAEEIVRQLRLRDIGGIIVVDFIDMVLESNRDLVVRRLVECLARDRTKHQVAEVTSLGLVQMTRKRVGSGLVEVYGEACEHCDGHGLVVKDAPVAPKSGGSSGGGGRRGGGRQNSGGGQQGSGQQQASAADQGAQTPSRPSGPSVAQIARAVHAAALKGDTEAGVPAAQAATMVDQQGSQAQSATADAAPEQAAQATASQAGQEPTAPEATDGAVTAAVPTTPAAEAPAVTGRIGRRRPASDQAPETTAAPAAGEEQEAYVGAPVADEPEAAAKAPAPKRASRRRAASTAAAAPSVTIEAAPAATTTVAGGAGVSSTSTVSKRTPRRRVTAPQGEGTTSA